MNYTQKKQSVIFELELSSFFGKTYSYYKGERKEKYISSIQDWGEDFYLNFESFFPYIDLENDGQYYNLTDAENWLIKKGYTQAEIDLFRGTLEEDQRRALADSRDSSYQLEYSKKLYNLIQSDAEEVLADNLSIPFKVLDDITNKDFQRNHSDQQYIRVEIKKADIKEALKNDYPAKDWHKDKEYIDYFNDYILDFYIKETNREYIDYYGTLGDSDDWLDCFKDCNEIENEILEYRKEEQDKKNNFIEFLQVATAKLNDLTAYLDQHITKEPEKSKITRQIKALKSVIKNAV